MITSPGQQDSLFQRLLAVAGNQLPESSLQDSLAFLVLPVQASCPSCRKKTIDSIMKHQEDLPADHYIIIAANGGRKTIRGYFREQTYELPDIGNQLLLDSNNLSSKNKLYENNPAIYYSHARKVYKKIASIPATVREDLREFFSDSRKPNE